jgi:hypothetical protein
MEIVYGILWLLGIVGACWGLAILAVRCQRYILPILALVILCCSSVRAGILPNDWTRGDTDKLCASTALILVDWHMTSEGLEQGYVERNPLLGDNPSPERLRTHFIVGIALNALIARLLPHEWRKEYLSIIIAGEGAATVYHLGIGIKF